MPPVTDPLSGQANSNTPRRRSTSDSSEDGLRLSSAAARRVARRSLRRMSPTPDLVTSLVRPPSPEAFYIAPQIQSRLRAEAQLRLNRESAQSSQRPLVQDRSIRSGPTLRPHASSLDISKRYGGDAVFDMYALTYVEEVDTALQCPICHDPLVDPITTPCDHTFCYRCLRRSIASSPSGTTCPIDREPLMWLDCFSAERLVRSLLSNLMVKCPHHNAGCERQLRREAVEKHARFECRFAETPCPGKGCEKTVVVTADSDKCLHYEITCKYCEAKIEEAARKTHLLLCPKTKTRCESCWEMVCRSDMATHQSVYCDGVEVDCTYHELGCPVRTIRGELGGHTMMCAFHPETASGAVIRSQRDTINSHADLRSLFAEMRVRQEETNRRLDEIVQPNSQLAAEPSTSGGSDNFLPDKRTMNDLDVGFEEIHKNLTHMEARGSMFTLNQVMPIREEVTELRNNINMIRMHVNWLLNRSREEGRIRAANTPGVPAPAVRRDSSGDVLPPLPERRRSDGSETDLPRL